MFKITLFAISVIFMAFACQEDKLVPEKSQSDVVIRIGTICGWCSRDDTLTISGNSVRYVNFAECNNITPAVEKNGQLATSELESLLAKLDFNELKKLDLNSCNVCFDGCDDWLYFDNGSESHYIRFTSNDPKLQPIKKFIDQLNAVKTQYMGNN